MRRVKTLNKEVIYHGECHCLCAEHIHDDKCLKRYILIYDYFKAKSYYLAFCSEWYRLHYKSFMINNPNFYRPQDELIKNIIKEHTDYNFSHSSLFGSGIKNSARVVVCERPYLYSDIPLIDLLNVIKNRNSDFEILDKAVFLSVDFIHSQVDKILSYAKYKKHHEQAKKIKRLSLDRYKLSYNQDNIISELIDFTTDVIIKNTK